MGGDKYQVFYSEDGSSVLYETADNWTRAKELRGNAFNQNRRIKAAWVMRVNPSLGLRPEKYGFTLRRSKREMTA